MLLAVDFVTEILPILVFMLGVISLLIALPSFFRDREKHKQTDEDKDALYSLAVAYVMGREAHPERGEDEIIGLRKIVPELQRRVDAMTSEIGDRAELHDTNIVELIQEIQRDVNRLAKPKE